MSRFSKKQLKILNKKYKGKVEFEKLIDEEIARILVDDYYQYNELIYYDNKNLVNEFGQDFANILVIAWDVIYEEMRR
ncbi:MAG: hypothetical protein ACRCW0_05200 [Clostridium sp.]|uniref:hypothetical protein n=1 Tax=Clostridium sp. TaxID=1506 RepID=UPI003F2B9585